MTDRVSFIRPARRDDIAALIALFRASVRLIARRDYTEEQVLAWAPDEIDAGAWTRRHETRRAWLAELGSTIVGFIELESSGHLDMAYVHPDYQRRGVGSALLAQVEVTARKQGIRRLFTEASITARPFFERRGFLLIAPQTVVLRGQCFANFRMEKPLA
jgi:putative acetyltransferase